MVQVKWAGHPKQEPYRDKNGILIIETADQNVFFSELLEQIKLQKEADAKSNKIRGELTTALNDPAKDIVGKSIDEEQFRHPIIATFARANLISVTVMIQFLSKCLEVTDERSKPSDAFEAYNHKLLILLDLIVKLPVDKLHPIMFDYVA
ncbi:MAG: hypothetical protein JNM39_01355 [Bdellovibrionaceae bacterium]|nr:hypothetical protein [Pseudobdellovibrionaceae bacterium]